MNANLLKFFIVEFHMEELILILSKHEDHFLFWEQMLKVTPSPLKTIGAVFLTKDLNEQD